MDPQSIAMIAAMFLMVAFSAYFSATETAFTSLNRIRLKSKADAGDRRAARTLALAEDYDRLLSTILIGNNIVNISASTLGTVLFTKHVGTAYGPAVSTIVLTVIILIFGEISPKSLAKEQPEAFAMFSAPILRLLMMILRPLNFLFAQWKRLLSLIFRSSSDSGITEEELITMVDQAETEGGLDQDESELIRSAIEFGDLEVDEILTPRVDIVAVEDTDTIVGVIHEKDFHAARYHGHDDVSAIVSTVLYTTANTKISDLLRILQKAKAHMVIVVDEYGGTEGLCTMEDIVEELVGEIWDEHDEVIEEFKKQPDGSYLISCNANLTDLYDLFSIKGESDSTTVSGWVMEEVGRVPEEGDHFVYENLDVTVTKVDHRRVLEIRVVVLDQSPDEEKPEK